MTHLEPTYNIEVEKKLNYHGDFSGEIMFRMSYAASTKMTLTFKKSYITKILVQ